MIIYLCCNRYPNSAGHVRAPLRWGLIPSAYGGTREELFLSRPGRLRSIYAISISHKIKIKR